MIARTSPDLAPPPAFVLVASGEACAAAVGAGLDEPAAARLTSLAAAQAPFGPLPPSDELARRYLAAVGAGRPAQATIEQARRFQGGRRPDPRVDLVWSATPAGEALLDRVRRTGTPRGLQQMGFVDEGEFWAPWCAALADGEAVALGFAARLTPTAACAGVAVASAFRRRGLGRAAVAGWSRHPGLAGKTLFYGHVQANAASAALADSLHLEPFAGVLEITVAP